MSTWIAVLAVGLGSYAFRLTPLLVRDRAVVGARFDHVVRLAATAALTALVVTSTIQASRGGPWLPVIGAVAIGLVLSARRASILRVVVVGLGMYLALHMVVTGAL